MHDLFEADDITAGLAASFQLIYWPSLRKCDKEERLRLWKASYKQGSTNAMFRCPAKLSC